MSTASPSRNAFTADFLNRLDEIGEPDGTHEADVAGPWVVRQVAAGGNPRPAGQPGNPGNVGNPGDPGDPGDPGSPGSPGNIGSVGNGGNVGNVGRLGEGFAVLREWERPEEGDEPYATFSTRDLALMAAAILPATGREPLFRLGTEPDEAGFPLLARAPAGAGGGQQGVAIAGHLRDFDEDLAAGLNFVAALVRSPRALARILEAAGHVALSQAGKALERSIRERRQDPPSRDPS